MGRADGDCNGVAGVFQVEYGNGDAQLAGHALRCARGRGDDDAFKVKHLIAKRLKSVVDFINPDFRPLRYGSPTKLPPPSEHGCASEQPHVTSMTQIGMRNFTFSGRGSYEEARAAGSEIVTMRRVRELGVDGVLELIPEGQRYYCTIDIDGLDPAIAPGTGSPSPGGFMYEEVIDLLRGVASRGQVVGIDLVEVAPPYDATGATSLLAAQLLLRFLGYVFAPGNDARESVAISR